MNDANLPKRPITVREKGGFFQVWVIHACVNATEQGGGDFKLRRQKSLQSTLEMLVGVQISPDTDFARVWQHVFRDVVSLRDFSAGAHVVVSY